MVKFKILAILLAINIVAFLSVESPLLAQGPTLALSPASGISAVTVVGDGFQNAYGLVNIYWDSVQIPTIPADVWIGTEMNPYGFTAMISVPTQTSPGDHVVTARVEGGATGSIAITASAVFTVVDTQGPAGETGPKGDTGEAGPQGPPGPTGSVVTTSGPPGETGPAGLSVRTASVDSTGQLTLTLSDGQTVSAGSVMGPQGPAGPPGPAGATGAVMGISILALILALATVVLIILSKLKKWIMS
jgi:hypothetical protein